MAFVSDFTASPSAETCTVLAFFWHSVDLRAALLAILGRFLSQFSVAGLLMTAGSFLGVLVALFWLYLLERVFKVSCEHGVDGDDLGALLPVGADSASCVFSYIRLGGVLGHRWSF